MCAVIVVGLCDRVRYTVDKNRSVMELPMHRARSRFVTFIDEKCYSHRFAFQNGAANRNFEH